MATVNEILNDLSNLEGVKAAVVAGRDGFCVESVITKGMDIDALGAIFSTSMSPSELMGNELKMGELTQNMIEFKHGNIILTAIGPNAILGVVTNSKANLGALRYNIKKIRGNLAKAL